MEGQDVPGVSDEVRDGVDQSGGVLVYDLPVAPALVRLGTIGKLHFEHSLLAHREYQQAEVGYVGESKEGWCERKLVKSYRQL